MEPQDESVVHPETLEQQDPEFVSNLGHGATYFLTTYGWYLAILGVAGLVAWNKWLKEKYETWKMDKDEREYDARYHKNPDVGVGRARQEAMEAARRKQQEKLNQASALAAEIEKEKEDQRRLEKLAEYDSLSGGGRRLGSSFDDNLTNIQLIKKARSKKAEYNPLNGSGGSGGYRPAPRGCPGGGCDRR